MTRSRLRFASLPAVAVAVVMASLGGCAVLGTQSESCVEWVWFENPADAMAEADLVVRTTGPTASTGTARLFGAAATAHSVDDTEVLKGDDAEPGLALTVIATPVTCTGGDVYPVGDPLDASGPLVLLLDWDADAEAWRTITPHQGVLPVADDGTIPESWPIG